CPRDERRPAHRVDRGRRQPARACISRPRASVVVPPFKGRATVLGAANLVRGKLLLRAMLPAARVAAGLVARLWFGPPQCHSAPQSRPPPHPGSTTPGAAVESRASPSLERRHAHAG